MRRRAFASLVSALLLSAITTAAAPSARAGEKETCLAASEDGQRARLAGRLIDAQASFAQCARDVCPSIVREACATWQDEVARSVPTVSVGVRDADGRDVLDVHLTVDGRDAPQHAAGRSFPLDPGMHVFRAEAGGRPPVEERVLVKEGEKARTINLRLPGPSRGATETQPGPPEAARRSVVPIVVMGVGVVATGVGLGLHFAGKGAFPENCRTDATTVEGRAGTCTPTAADPTGASSVESASSSVTQRNVGTGLTVGGLALALGGLVWFFVDSPGPRKTATHVTPSVGTAGAGLVWSGAF